VVTTTEDNFFGKVAMLEPSADPIRFNEVIVGRVPADRVRSNQHLARETSGSGSAAVWARDNTRDARRRSGTHHDFETSSGPS
jgi:hypothetical protein